MFTAEAFSRFAMFTAEGFSRFAKVNPAGSAKRVENFLYFPVLIAFPTYESLIGRALTAVSIVNEAWKKLWKVETLRS